MSLDVEETETLPPGSERSAEATSPTWWLVVRKVLIGFLFALVVVVALAAVVVPLVIRATPYTVLTGSMRPVMPPGTLVVARPVDPESISVGDVVTYQIASGRPEVVTHRVVGLGVQGAERTFVTQGDDNTEPDPEKVLAVQVRGKVLYSVPLLGYVNNVLNGDQRRSVLSVVSGAAILYGAVSIVRGVLDRQRDQALQGKHVRGEPR